MNDVILAAARNAGVDVMPAQIRELHYVARADGPRFDPFNNINDAWRLVNGGKAIVTIATTANGNTTATAKASKLRVGVATAKGSDVRALCEAITLAFYHLTK